MKNIAVFSLFAASLFAGTLPDLKENNELSFKAIEGYEKWQVAATH